MAFSTSSEQEQNFQNFVKDLTELSKKYKVAISSIGGVHIYSPDEDLSDIIYSTDSSSGDLSFVFLREKNGYKKTEKMYDIYQQNAGSFPDKDDYEYIKVGGISGESENDAICNWRALHSESFWTPIKAIEAK